MLVQELMQHTIMESLKRKKHTTKQRTVRMKEENTISNITQDVPACDCMFLLVYIVVVTVVASQGDERAQAQSVGKKYLSCCIQPHLSDNTCAHIQSVLSTNMLV